MSSLREFFDTMSEHAQWRERRGEVREAQNIRDRRNAHWDLGARGDVRYQQLHAESRSWR
jgi:hypothetical protein